MVFGLLGEESQFSPLFVVDFEPFPITLDVEVCKFITQVNRIGLSFRGTEENGRQQTVCHGYRTPKMPE